MGLGDDHEGVAVDLRDDLFQGGDLVALDGAQHHVPLLAALLPLEGEQEIAVTSAEGRCVVFSSALLAPKTSRTTQGVQVMTVKKHPVVRAALLADTPIRNQARYRVRSLPAAGAKLTDADRGEEQMTFI